MNTWITSDLHFQHRNVIKYSKRIQYCSETEKDVLVNGTKQEIRNLHICDESVERMNEGLIENWNSKVGTKDEIYILGDFSFGSVEKAKEILERLNGKKYLILGNHDDVALKVPQYFVWQKEYFKLRYNVKEIKYRIILSHYCHLVWENMHTGYFHCYGHSHGSVEHMNTTRPCMDVGVDTNNMFPYSLDDVIDKLKTRTFVPVDHHV